MGVILGRQVYSRRMFAGLAPGFARTPTIPGMTQALDICIRGAGIVGRTLALLLARERLRVGLVAPTAAGTSQLAADVRAYALNARSRALLESLRCWPDASHATEVRHMQVKGDDGGEVNFDAAHLQVAGLTWVVDVPALEAQLAQALRFQPHIQLLDAPQPAALTVICDGRASRTRAEFDIDFDVTPYPQIAIAARLTCQLPHNQTAFQWFSDGEIMAFLPLDGPQGNSVAVVWSVKEERAQTVLAQDPSAFCEQLEAFSQRSLGSLKLSSERRAWPLQMAQTGQWTGIRAGQAWALAGDAAHSVHPLAGQGLNLGLADVAALARTLHEREYWRALGDEKLLRRYQRSRKAEVLTMGAAMDGLHQLFAQSGPPWQAARNWGMNGFERSGPLKQWVARQAMGL